ncbi:helix-turn-helix domain-containing protein [Pseudarthrobacter sp. NPDC092184]|uniref:helix-turn-helix domain-containing protein n=1 Tax=unclassified Pseudarthrobacter TaxID=2647000 RepID=UPI00381B4EBC
MTDLKFAWHRALLESTLHDTTKLVGVALWDYADKDGCRAFPGNKTIAQRLDKSDRTVKSHMKKLRDEGWIERTSVSKNVAADRRLADEYRLVIPGGKVQSSLHLTEVGKVQSGPPSKVQPGASKVQGSLHPNKHLRTRREEQGGSFGTTAQRSRTRISPVPAEFSISASMKTWASENAPAANLELVTTKFRNYYEAAGTERFSTLEPLWRNWMLEAHDHVVKERARRNPFASYSPPTGNEKKLIFDYDNWGEDEETPSN